MATIIILDGAESGTIEITRQLTSTCLETKPTGEVLFHFRYDEAQISLTLAEAQEFRKKIDSLEEDYMESDDY